MSEVVAVAFEVVVLIVVIYVVILGGIGVVLSRSRGRGGLWGFCWGILVPFAGWGWILWRTRDLEAHRRQQLDEVIAGLGSDAPTPPPGTSGSPSDLSKYEY